MQVLTALLARALITKVSVEKASRDLPPATKRSLQAPLDRMLALYGTRRGAGGDVDREEEREAPGSPSKLNVATAAPVSSSGHGTTGLQRVGSAGTNTMKAAASVSGQEKEKVRREYLIIAAEPVVMFSCVMHKHIYRLFVRMSVIRH